MVKEKGQKDKQSSTKHYTALLILLKPWVTSGALEE